MISARIALNKGDYRTRPTVTKIRTGKDLVRALGAVEADLADQWEKVCTMHGDVRRLPRDDHIHVSSSLRMPNTNYSVRVREGENM
jgi:hypothetical protein